MRNLVQNIMGLSTYIHLALELAVVLRVKLLLHELIIVVLRVL